MEANAFVWWWWLMVVVVEKREVEDDWIPVKILDPKEK